MKKINFTYKPVLFISCLFFLFPCGYSADKVSWDYADTILSNIKPPVFPEKEFVITTYGAIGDGATDCTQAIQQSIDICNKVGGGKVIVPKGTFFTGAIHLKSNVNLHLQEGSVLLFSQEPEKYLPVVATRFEGVDLMNYSPFIYCYGAKNIAITGKGLLDGNSDSTNWWQWKGISGHTWKPGMKNQNADRDSLFIMNRLQIPVEKRVFGKSHYLRPSFIEFINCENILIQDVRIVRSPMWEIHPVLCNNVTVQGISIESHGPNNDGCNPESCKNVLIENCYFNVGDDCIAIKSGREADGKRINIPSENIIVRNCMMKDGHGGVVIGSEITGGCRNVFIENCKMDSPNLDRALRIKSNSLRGGLVENIFMRNVEVGEVREAVIYVDLFYEKGDVGKETPIVRNVYVENVNSLKSEYAVWLRGYKRSPVENIQITNCQFNGVEKGNNISNANDVAYNEVSINNKKVK